jgi:ABC-type molybdenum transport system ATPase subunit/photorepair protein PhrA
VYAYFVTHVYAPPLPMTTTTRLHSIRLRHVRAYSLGRFSRTRKPLSSEPIVSIENSAVYPLGTSEKTSKPLLREFRLVIEEGEAWAIVGTSGAGKDALIQVGNQKHPYNFAKSFM